MKELQSFFYGIKPAVLRPPEKVQHVNDRLDKYPKLSFGSTSSILYFQDDAMKELFETQGVFYVLDEEKGKRIKTFKRDLLGLALGYPPSAVKAFMEGIPEEDKCMIIWNGFNFLTRRDLADDAISYMEETYDVPAIYRSPVKIIPPEAIGIVKSKVRRNSMWLRCKEGYFSPTRGTLLVRNMLYEIDGDSITYADGNKNVVGYILGNEFYVSDLMSNILEKVEGDGEIIRTWVPYLELTYQAFECIPDFLLEQLTQKIKDGKKFIDGKQTTKMNLF